MNILLIKYYNKFTLFDLFHFLAYSFHKVFFSIKFFHFGLECIKSFCSDIINKFEIIYRTPKFIFWKPDIVGVSLSFIPNDEKRLIKFITKIKKRYKNSLIVAGGYYSNIEKEKLIQYFDGICMGEGEVPMKELIEAENKKEYLLNTPYWYTMRKENVYNYVLKDLDILKPIQRIEKHMPIMITRGCENACVFCPNPLIRNCIRSYPSIEKVISDLQYYIDNGAQSFLILDDVPWAEKEYWMTIMQFLKEKNCKIYFLDIDFTMVDEDLVRLYSEICDRNNSKICVVCLNLDSVSFDSMKNVGKLGLTKLDNLEYVIKLFQQYDFEVRSNVLIGFPWDNINDVRYNIPEIQQIGFDRVFYCSVIIYKGTELYNMAVKDGSITDLSKNIFDAKSNPYLLKLVKEDTKLGKLVGLNINS